MNLVTPQALTPPMPVLGAAVHIAGLYKRFGRQQVLEGLDLRIDKGKGTALLGPNGSGKTTLIKILLGLTLPDAGTITLNGQPVRADGAHRHQMGYMPQIARYPENLTGQEVLQLLSDLRGNPRHRDTELIDAFRLGPELGKPLRTLSGGTRQKVSAVLAFLFDPELLILDEPTAGLDPVASSVLKDKIQAAMAQGKTVLISSHIMSEIEELADHVAYLYEGRIRFNGGVAEIKAREGQPNLERAVAHMMRGAAL